MGVGFARATRYLQCHKQMVISHGHSWHVEKMVQLC